MKRLLVCLLCLLMMTMTACRGTLPTLTDHAGGQSTQGVLTPVFVTVDNIVIDGDRHYAEVTWHNDSDSEVTYGRPYGVERYENGEWVDCAMADICYTMEAILLRPHSENKETYPFVSHGETLFDVSRSGTYRITVNGNVGTETITLYAEFTV